MERQNNEYVIRKSKRKGKKYTLVTPEGKEVSFGASSYSDFL
jgi:hypothetical protein